MIELGFFIAVKLTKEFRYFYAGVNLSKIERLFLGVKFANKNHPTYRKGRRNCRSYSFSHKFLVQ